MEYTYVKHIDEERLLMEYVYSILTLSERELRLQKKKKFKIYEKILKTIMLLKLSVSREDITYIGQLGQKITFPFSSTDLHNFGREYLTEYLQRVCRKYHIEEPYLDKELRKYLGEENSYGEWMLKYLVFPSLFERIVSKYKIDCKNMKLVILDGVNSNMGFILELLLPDLNHLTLVTSRPSSFDKMIETVYEETGLLIEVIDYPVRFPIGADLIIDFCKDEFSSYYYFEKNAIVLDLTYNKEKLQYLSSRRKDLKVIYDVEVRIFQELVKKDLATFILGKKDWRLSHLIKGLDCYLELDQWRQIAKEYEIELEDIKVLNG